MEVSSRGIEARSEGMRGRGRFVEMLPTGPFRGDLHYRYTKYTQILIKMPLKRTAATAAEVVKERASSGLATRTASI